MLLKKIDNQKSETIRVTLKANAVSSLKEYVEYYEAFHGTKVTQGELLDLIIENFVDRDGKFAKWVAERNKPAAN